MSDAPAHELFVLTPPITEGNRLPEPLCVIQVALEGRISRQSVLNSLSRGSRPAGDLIPWLVSQQFQDDEFATLSGARVVRIATHPDYIGGGYGSKAIELLVDYYGGKFTNLSEEADIPMEETMVRVTDAELANANLRNEDIKVRDISKMPPLFAKLEERRPAALDYVGVSYGLTQPLHKFWKRAAFAPVYLRLTANDLTGEHTCVMLRPLTDDKSWLGEFANDFNRRFISLLSYQFRNFSPIMALSIDESATSGSQLSTSNTPAPLTKADLDLLFTPFDLKRLESYANNVLDYHVILDLVPMLATLYFTGRLQKDINLNGVQKAILLALGLQRKEVEVISAELPSISTSQVLAMFMKTMKKIASHFGSLVSGAIEAEMPKADAIGVSVANASSAHDDEKVDTQYAPLETSLEDELEEGGEEALLDLERRQKQRELIDSLPLDQ